ncbi:hypothetical protein HMPREF0645_1602 [Hallella bergensis DSM 17361]|uniref:Uncharacterized protein n=1 Tax=Hallella bergensis DSM 17361 TaxID=585502 RepID=D1PXB7_9BACT|nr:hypothetical protein HMPREF0645_1602 [Hallella bergensis DSM 17361]
MTIVTRHPVLGGNPNRTVRSFSDGEYAALVEPAFSSDMVEDKLAIGNAGGSCKKPDCENNKKATKSFQAAIVK